MCRRAAIETRSTAARSVPEHIRSLATSRIRASWRRVIRTDYRTVLPSDGTRRRCSYVIGWGAAWVRTPRIISERLNRFQQTVDSTKRPAQE